MEKHEQVHLQGHLEQFLGVHHTILWFFQLTLSINIFSTFVLELKEYVPSTISFRNGILSANMRLFVCSKKMEEVYIWRNKCNEQ